jgi:hypothetical protein
MARYRVDITEKFRTGIGIAKYNEYVKEMVEKHGEEKATDIITEPDEQLKNIQAFQILNRKANKMHPKGAPKTKKDLQNWTPADQVRLEMGEKEWLDSVKIVGQEFGPEKVERLFGLQKEKTMIREARLRVYPGSKEADAAAMAKARKILSTVKEAAPEAKTAPELITAFKTLYPTMADFEASL